MAYKIFRKGGYFYIIDTVTGRERDGLSKNVRVTRGTISQDDFYINGVNDWGNDEAINITEIQKEDGESYTLSEFITFYEGNTGSSKEIIPTSQFMLEVSKGNMLGHSVVDKFGENPSIDIGTPPEDIWEFGGVYIYDADGTAPIQYLSSSDVLDTEPIKITGLDINGDEVAQTITLTGQTNANLTTPLWRVYRVENEGVNDLIGTVYVHNDATPTAGVPDSADVRAIIENGNNQSLMAIYTVPKGKVGFLYRGEIGGSRAQTSGSAQCAYYSRRLGKVFKIKKRVDVANSGSSIYQDVRSFPDIIPSLTDIKLRVEAVSNNNTGLFGTIDILLIDEDQFSLAYLQAIGQPGY